MTADPDHEDWPTPINLIGIRPGTNTIDYVSLKGASCDVEARGMNSFVPEAVEQGSGRATRTIMFAELGSQQADFQRVIDKFKMVPNTIVLSTDRVL